MINILVTLDAKYIPPLKVLLKLDVSQQQR